MNLVWMPRVDGVFFTEAPQTLVKTGHVANIPFVNGAYLYLLSSIDQRWVHTKSRRLRWWGYIIFPLVIKCNVGFSQKFHRSLLTPIHHSSEEDTLNYIRSDYYPKTPLHELDAVLQLYPSDPSEGSPFNTSSNNTLSPQYKRISAIQGDIWLHGPRRLFFKYRSEKQKIWSYCKRAPSVIHELVM